MDASLSLGESKFQVNFYDPKNRNKKGQSHLEITVRCEHDPVFFRGILSTNYVIPATGSGCDPGTHFSLQIWLRNILAQATATFRHLRKEATVSDMLSIVLENSKPNVLLLHDYFKNLLKIKQVRNPKTKTYLR